MRVAKDGARLDVSLTISPLRDSEGNFIGASKVARDITEHKQAEKKLRLSEERYRHLAELLPVAVYTCEAPSGVITYYNSNAAQLWGRAPRLSEASERFCGSSKLRRLDGTLIPHEECPMAVALRDGQSFRNQDVMVERPDGSRINVLVNIDPIRNDSGAVVGAVNVFHDITALKQAEEALRESQEQLACELAAIQRLQATSSSLIQESDSGFLYQKILDAAADIMRSDFASIQVVDEERNALRMLAWRGFGPAFGKVFEFIGPDMRTSCSVARRTARRVIVSDVETCDFIVGTPALEDHRRTGIRAVQSTPLISRTGKTLGMISTHWQEPYLPSERDLRLLDLLARQAADLLDRSQADQALREQKASLETLLETLPVGVIIAHDIQCRRVSGNRAATELLRVPHDSNISMSAPSGEQPSHLRILKHGQVIPPESLPVQRAARGEIVRAEELDHVFDDGSVVHTLVSAQPLYDSDGGCRGAVGSILDVTDLKNAETALRDADRRKDEFLATLAHELRNPLAPVSNALQVMRMSDDMNASVGELRDVMERQVNHLIRLVNDLMEVSRISRGKIELRKEPIELSAVIRTAIEISQPLIDEAGHRLTVSLPPKTIFVDGDHVRLSQVVTNLLTNAAKYMEAGGLIELAVRPEGCEAVISVHDTGLGIAREMLPGIFEMFGQIEHTRSRAQGGLGIGLALAKHLIEMHGGRIEARSDGLGKGSQFTVRLPLANNGRRDRIRESTSWRRLSLPARKVLVVDDTRAALFVLDKLLTTMGQQVRTVPDAASALESARGDPPDIVISDIGMPGIDGYGLARRLRQEPRLKDVVLVALTGYGQASDRQRAKDAGFDHHLVKPVDVRDLQTLLEAIPLRPGF